MDNKKKFFNTCDVLMMGQILNDLNIEFYKDSYEHSWKLREELEYYLNANDTQEHFLDDALLVLIRNCSAVYSLISTEYLFKLANDLLNTNWWKIFGKKEILNLCDTLLLTREEEWEE